VRSKTGRFAPSLGRCSLHGRFESGHLRRWPSRGVGSVLGFSCQAERALVHPTNLRVREIEEGFAYSAGGVDNPCTSTVESPIPIHCFEVAASAR